MTLNAFEIVLLTCVILLVVLPPKYDPAIRFKEWLNKGRDQ